MQYSDEYKKALVDRPRENLPPSDWKGRIRVMYFKFTGAAAGGVNAIVAQLPAGRVRFLGDLSYMINSAIVVGVGWGAYRQPNTSGGYEDVAASSNGIDAAKTAGAGNLGSALTATTKVFNSEEGVDITLTLTAETDTAEGWIAYAID